MAPYNMKNRLPQNSGNPRWTQHFCTLLDVLYHLVPSVSPETSGVQKTRCPRNRHCPRAQEQLTPHAGARCGETIDTRAAGALFAGLGTAGAAVLFGAGGASLTGWKLSKRWAHIKEFEFVEIPRGSSDTAIVPSTSTSNQRRPQAGLRNSISE